MSGQTERDRPEPQVHLQPHLGQVTAHLRESTPLPHPLAAQSPLQPLDDLNDSRATSQSPILTREGQEMKADNQALLGKISKLQNEREVNLEKISMLEHSSSAMADDLVKKSAIIQFYAMAEKQKNGELHSMSCKSFNEPPHFTFQLRPRQRHLACRS